MVGSGGIGRNHLFFFSPGFPLQEAVSALPDHEFAESLVLFPRFPAKPLYTNPATKREAEDGRPMPTPAGRTHGRDDGMDYT